MALTLRTPTRVVSMTLIDPATGLNWVHDYVGNNLPAEMVRDPEGQVDYLTDDETATWWQIQCEAQQEADNALAELTAEQRADVLASIGSLDLDEQPGAILEAVRTVK